MSKFIKAVLCAAVLVSLTIATAQAGWIYLAPDFHVFGFRDYNGVLHASYADEARYNNATRVYQVLIHNHWLTVGEDIYQLN